MEASLFIEYVQKLFKKIAHGVVTRLNGTEKKLTYLHRTRLRKEYSVSGKWESITVNGSMVAADYVAMDSSLPLKMRDSFGKASGDIPKQGMELALNEQQLTDLDVMVAQNEPESAISAKLFQDTPKVIGGIYEKNEASYLIGLSTGVTVVEDDKNTGTGIRLDFKYLPENKFGTSSVVWSNPASTPLTDINTKILAKASLDGKTVNTVFIDRGTFNNIAKTGEAKDLYAMSIGNFGETKPVPNLTRLNAAVQDEYGYVFQIVDRSVTVEKNGVRSAFKPWADGAVAAVTSDIDGTLTYAKLAEQNHPVANVTYELVDDYILVSKYRQNKPSLAEFTSSQARVAPVISETVYLLDSKTVQA
jgi:hypothetical protein